MRIREQNQAFAHRDEFLYALDGGFDGDNSVVAKLEAGDGRILLDGRALMPRRLRHRARGRAVIGHAIKRAEDRGDDVFAQARLKRAQGGRVQQLGVDALLILQPDLGGRCGQVLFPLHQQQMSQTPIAGVSAD